MSRIALSRVLKDLADWSPPQRTVELSPFEAVGRWLAADVHAVSEVPAQSLALRPGYAVNALDLVGASAQNPVPLLNAQRLGIGEALPAGTNAILDASAIERHGELVSALDAVEPGAAIRRRGHDLAAGRLIAPRGARITPEVALALAAAGLERVAIVDVCYRVDGLEPPIAHWLHARLSSLGLPSATNADIMFCAGGATRSELALTAAEAAEMNVDGTTLRIALPARLDAAVAVWCAMMLPTLAARLGTAIATRPARAHGKMSSQLGLDEIALLRVAGDTTDVLAVGDMPLSAIAAGNAFAILDAASEGEPAGATVQAVMLDDPFCPTGVT